MNTDINKLRSIPFREFCDRWLDQLDANYDDVAQAWIDLFREEIFVSLLNLRQKVERTQVYLRTFDNDEVFKKMLDDFLNAGSEEGLNLPAFERLLPLLRSLGAKDDDNMAAVLAILAHAKSGQVKAEKSHKAGDGKAT